MGTLKNATSSGEVNMPSINVPLHPIIFVANSTPSKGKEKSVISLETFESIVKCIDDFSVVVATFLVLLVNIISIDIGSAVVFYTYGVAPKKVEKNFFSTHMKVAVLLLFMLSLPFAYTSYLSYQHSQDEQIIRGIVDMELRVIGGTAEYLDISSGKPIVVKLKVVAPNDVPQHFANTLESKMESSLNKDIVLRLTYVKSETV